MMTWRNSQRSLYKLGYEYKYDNFNLYLWLYNQRGIYYIFGERYLTVSFPSERCLRER
ncbi:hypothetical protein OGM63_00750 [Plectonema radiosum NIES-515]|uniref:Uncharacterized protein n=1 Tax=Plectonema radiosum NIES-515 TaxID=2986073 RepID=A0ABT3ASM2_9CYAN|nr:hypothetical protein [Plectonema radiosum]MCV3212065.1 hypothetical protein [Plectonema radiosum NIES-515]